MTDRREHHESDSFGVEIQGPDGVHVERFPFKEQLPMGDAPWTMQHMTRVKTLLEAAGYEQTAPTQEGVLFAFAPKVHADEAGPFDTEAQSLCERLSLIPGTRAHSLKKTPTGLSGRLTDYGSGRTMDVRLDDVQPELQDVPNEALRRSKERTDACRLTQHDGSYSSPVPLFKWVRYSTRGQESLRLNEGYSNDIDWSKVAWYRVADEADAEIAVEAVNGRNHADHR